MTDSRRFKAVLFDIDGTLIDSNEHHVVAWEAAFLGEGIAIDRPAIHGQIGKGADLLLPALVPRADAAQRDRLAEAHGAVFKARFLPEVAPFPGARDLLAAVAGQGQSVVLASSASKDELDHYVDLLGAGELVAATTSADDVAATKPAPDIFATALDRIAPIAARDAIVIGDTPYDIEAAARCGIAAIGVRSGGFDDAALTAAGAGWLYDDVAALLADLPGSPLGAAR